jgi:hypothetical protein
MAADVYTVDGAKELRRALKKAGLDIQALKDTHAEVAQLVKERALQRVPVRTGALRESLRSSGTVSGALVRAGGRRVPYASPIHWGWRKRNIAANPFIYGAADDTQANWEHAYLMGIQAIIREIEGSTYGIGLRPFGS